ESGPETRPATCRPTLHLRNAPRGRTRTLWLSARTGPQSARGRPDMCLVPPTRRRRAQHGGRATAERSLARPGDRRGHAADCLRDALPGLPPAHVRSRTDRATSSAPPAAEGSPPVPAAHLHCRVSDSRAETAGTSAFRKKIAIVHVARAAAA